MATLILHFDLNKTVLAVDEVKGFGREDIIYLEEFKDDRDFLAWASSTKGPGTEGEEAEEWINNLKVSKNEPELIALAKQYVALDPQRTATIEATLGLVREDNSCESFWELLRWAKEQEQERVLVVFRTFGIDMPEMFERCEANGFGDCVLRVEGNGDQLQPSIWTMLHQLPEEKGPYDVFRGTKDTIVDGTGRELLNPGPQLPGPKEKGTEEFKVRSVGLEEAASALFKDGKQLEPFVFMGPPRILPDSSTGTPRLATLTSEDVATHVPVPAVQALGVDGALGAIGFEADARLRIMGVQDNYKPWSRKNWRSGKTAVLPPPGTHTKQLFFGASVTRVP